MNLILRAWNDFNLDSAIDTLISCCAARRWAATMSEQRPFLQETDLLRAADRVWDTMGEADWLEAFSAHPRIGEQTVSHATQQSRRWSEQEQDSAKATNDNVLAELAIDNHHYEERFGFTYIVCATGKSGPEMLGILKRRIHNDRQTELKEAAEQQRQIMHIRLKKWLQL